MSVGRALNDRQFLHGFLLVVCEGLGHRCEVRLQVFVERLRCMCLRHDNELRAREGCRMPARARRATRLASGGRSPYVNVLQASCSPLRCTKFDHCDHQSSSTRRPGW